jgi:hypothetical protein
LNLEVKKIRLSELEGFVQSETYRRLNTIPITPERAQSFIKNPNANGNDVVLYLGFIENKTVAFRTIFAGKLNSGKQQNRFGWCSGNWVHPDFRRKGFSEQLLKEAYADWNGKLMFTNYAPNSENLYLKTGWFKPIHRYEGIRGYLFPKTQKLIVKAKKNKILKLFFSNLDFLISIFSRFRLLFYSKKNQKNIQFETISIPDEQCYLHHKKNDSEYLFKLGESEFKWIFNYPWISNTKQSFTDKYPFSSYSSSFHYETIKIFIENKFSGFFIFSVREGHLKTLFFSFPDGIEKEIANFFKQFCVTYKIELITVYNSQVANQFIERKFPFLHVKNYGQKIYSSFEIDNKQELSFHDCDGDVIFT